MGAVAKAPSTSRRRNLKTQLYFTVRPTVHTNPSRQRSFSRTLFKPEAVWKRFRVDGKHFENGTFRKRCVTIIMWFSLTEFFSNTNPKWPVAFSNSSGIVCPKNIWCVFRVKPSFSNSAGALWTRPKRLSFHRSTTWREDQTQDQTQWCWYRQLKTANEMRKTSKPLLYINHSFFLIFDIS